MTKGTNIKKASAMRALFASELDAKTESFRSHLLAIEQGNNNSHHLDALIVICTEIKGGARLAKLDPAMALAGEMEMTFSHTREGILQLDSGHIDIFLDGVDILHDLAAIGVEKQKFSSEEISRSVELIEQLHNLTAGKSVTMPVVQKKDKLPESVAPADLNSNKEQKLNATKDKMDSQTSRLRSLFWTELGEKIEVLTQNLLAMEQGIMSPKRLEAMMRMAHTIKGGARLSKIEPVMQIAHVMEDIFVAAQKGELDLETSCVDALLETVDTVLALSESAICKLELDEDEISRASAAVLVLTNILAGEYVPHVKVVVPQDIHDMQIPGSVAHSSVLQESASDSGGRVLRVSAKNMDRIIGLAGELSVENRQIKDMRRNVIWVRRRIREVTNAFVRFNLLLSDTDAGQMMKSQVSEIAEKAAGIESAVTESFEILEQHDSRINGLTRKMYLEVLSHRMRPFADGVFGLQRLVRDTAQVFNKQVKLEIVGEDTRVDQDILEQLNIPLTHLLQNSIDHAIEKPDARRAAGKQEYGLIRIAAEHKGGMLSVSIEDDGCGIDKETLRRKIIEKKLAPQSMVEEMSDVELFDFLLLPNFTLKGDVSTVSGRGVGLDIVHDMVRNVRGTVHITSTPGQGTRFELIVPITLSVIRCVVVEISDCFYALPVARIEQVINLPFENIRILEGRRYLRRGKDENIGIVSAHHVLELPESGMQLDFLSAVILGRGRQLYAIAVDRIVCEMDLVERPLTQRLGKVQDVSAAAFLEDGTPVLILDVDDLMRTIDKVSSGENIHKVNHSDNDARLTDMKRVLVVDDSLTVREVERNLLSHKGFDVDVAIDGMDAWNAIRMKKYDLIVTDIDMPRMDGLELIKMIRADNRLKEIPIIVISYKDREEDRKRGFEVGADHYLTKGSFEDETFVNSVVDLIGAP